MVSCLQDINTYTRNKSTAPVEALHGLSCKYAPKWIHYSVRQYSARKGLAVLDWNENAHQTQKNSKRKRTHNFRDVIVNKYLTIEQNK